MVVGAGGGDELVLVHQLIIAAAVHAPLQEAQDQGGDQRHGQIGDHFDGGGGEVEVSRTHGRAVYGEQLAIGDDEHDGGILDVDDQVVADLGQQHAEGLGDDDIEHGLHMVHADGLGALGLAGVDGEEAAADGFGHVSAGVDGTPPAGRPETRWGHCTRVPVK